jgi:RNA polymerase sigma-70 factor, ECF subfamily
VLLAQALLRPAANQQGAEIPEPDSDLAHQREVVDAFYRAARGGDFDALVALLDPDMVLREDLGAGRPPALIRGAAAIARRARAGAMLGALVRPALVNGAAGAVITVRGQPFAVMGFTVVNGKILEIDVIADPERVPRIAAAVLGT